VLWILPNLAHQFFVLPLNSIRQGLRVEMTGAGDLPAQRHALTVQELVKIEDRVVPPWLAGEVFPESFLMHEVHRDVPVKNRL
jgi:hypothetical protein